METKENIEKVYKSIEQKEKADLMETFDPNEIAPSDYLSQNGTFNKASTSTHKKIPKKLLRTPKCARL